MENLAHHPLSLLESFQRDLCHHDARLEVSVSGA